MKDGSTTCSDTLSILIAEDVPAWRTHIRSMLQTMRDWSIAFEASDGVTAVQKAAELLPDIVLLDIGLPRLSGIEAAEQIRHCSPNSRIIFVTAESDWDVRKLAMATGAKGYVLKLDVQRELVPAIAAAVSWDGSGEAYLKPGKIFDELADALRLDVFFNFLVVPGAGHLRLSACGGIPRSEAEEIDMLQFGQAICGTVAQTRKPMLVRDVLNVKDERVHLIRSTEYGYTTATLCWKEIACWERCRLVHASGLTFGRMNFS